MKKEAHEFLVRVLLWVILALLAVTFLGGCEFKKLPQETTDYINNRLFPPQNAILYSSEEANKRFEEFERLLDITLQKAISGTNVEPMLTENIDCILEKLKEKK